MKGGGGRGSLLLLFLAEFYNHTTLCCDRSLAQNSKRILIVLSLASSLFPQDKISKYLLPRAAH